MSSDNDNNDDEGDDGGGGGGGGDDNDNDYNHKRIRMRVAEFTLKTTFQRPDLYNKRVHLSETIHSSETDASSLV